MPLLNLFRSDLPVGGGYRDPHPDISQGHCRPADHGRCDIGSGVTEGLDFIAKRSFATDLYAGWTAVRSLAGIQLSSEDRPVRDAA